MTTLTCISPIDGSVYAERPAMSLAGARAAVARARDAQRQWAARPLAERAQSPAPEPHVQGAPKKRRKRG